MLSLTRKLTSLSLRPPTITALSFSTTPPAPPPTAKPNPYRKNLKIGNNNLSSYTVPPYLSKLSQFFPNDLGAGGLVVGKQWHARMLRGKSFEDLHALWFVLYKEQNLLRTELQHCRRKSIPYPKPERNQYVKKSMGAIRQVLGERRRGIFFVDKEKEEVVVV